LEGTGTVARLLVRAQPDATLVELQTWLRTEAGRIGVRVVRSGGCWPSTTCAAKPIAAERDTPRVVASGNLQRLWVQRGPDLFQFVDVKHAPAFTGKWRATDGTSGQRVGQVPCAWGPPRFIGV
jgi:hypothetical protein